MLVVLIIFMFKSDSNDVRLIWCATPDQFSVTHIFNEEKGKVIICVIHNIIPNLVDLKLCVYNSMCNCELFDQLIMYRH